MPNVDNICQILRMSNFFNSVVSFSKFKDILWEKEQFLKVVMVKDKFHYY